MKSLLYLWLAISALVGILPARYGRWIAQSHSSYETTEGDGVSDFDKAVEIIKKYETLHQPKHWPLVGYGHQVLPGESFSRTKAMSPEKAEELLRKDLLKNCAVFRSYGADSLLLGVLAYNIGSGNVKKSTLVKKLKEGNRDVYDNYVAFSKYRGKTHAQLKNRRIEEFETLFIKEYENTDNSANPVIVVEKSTQIEETI